MQQVDLANVCERRQAAAARCAASCAADRIPTAAMNATLQSQVHWRLARAGNMAASRAALSAGRDV